MDSHTPPRPAAAGAPALRAPLGRPPSACGPSGSSRPALRGTARAPMLRAYGRGQKRRGAAMGPRRFLLFPCSAPPWGLRAEIKGMALMNLGPTTPALPVRPCLAGVGAAAAGRRRAPNTLSGHPKTVRGTPPPCTTPAGAAARLKCTAASGRPCPVPAGAAITPRGPWSARCGGGAPPPHKSRFGAPSGGRAACRPRISNAPPEFRRLRAAGGDPLAQSQPQSPRPVRRALVLRCSGRGPACAGRSDKGLWLP